MGAALVLIATVGAGLRMYGLGRESLWPDEIYSVTLSRSLDAVAILRGVTDDVHPPGYQLLLAVFIALFGESEAAVRALSALAGALAVPLLYLLGRNLFGRAEGLLAAALLAVSVNAVFYSQEARSFALLLLGSVAMGLVFHQAFLVAQPAATHRWRWCAIYIAVGVAALYVHYYALLVLAVQLVVGAAVAYRRPQARVPLLAACLGIGLGFAPWLPVLLRHLQIKQWWIPQPDFSSLAELFWFVFSDSSALAITCAVVATVALIAAARAPARWGERAPGLAWLLAWALLPPLAAYVKSLVSTPIFTPRNLIICLPPVYLLMARTCTAVIALITAAPARRLQLACVVAVAGLALGTLRFFDQHFYETPRRMQYREAAWDVLQNGASSDDVVIIATDDRFDFYLEKFGHGRRTDYRLTTPEEFARLAGRNVGRFWLLQGFNHAGDDTPLVRAIETGYRPVYKRGFFVTQVMLFERSDVPLPSAVQP